MPDAGRVIAGTAGSIRLDAPGPGTRPLADRVKQTLFAILEPDLPGARVLDLFAGSGAAGHRGPVPRRRPRDLRGTRRRRDPGHPDQPRTDRSGRPSHRRSSPTSLAWLRDPARAADPPIAIAIVDPPYDEPATLTAALEHLASLLAPGARVVAKHFWRNAPPARIGLLASERERRFGETALTFYRSTADTTEDA